MAGSVVNVAMVLLFWQQCNSRNLLVEGHASRCKQPLTPRRGLLRAVVRHLHSATGSYALLLPFSSTFRFHCFSFFIHPIFIENCLSFLWPTSPQQKIRRAIPRAAIFAAARGLS
jgi:hypothetical protein